MGPLRAKFASGTTDFRMGFIRRTKFGDKSISRLSPCIRPSKQTMSTGTPNKRNERRGATVLLEVLRSEGAGHAFGDPGTTELPLIDALVDASDIDYIWGAAGG